MSEQLLKAYVPREIISLGLSPLDTLALLVLSSLPYGLYGTQQWFAELLQKDKAQMSRTIKSLRKNKLIYEDFGSGESVIKVNNDEVLKIYAERLAKGLIKERSQDKGLLAPKSKGSDNYAQKDNSTKNADCGKTCGKTVGNLWLLCCLGFCRKIFLFSQKRSAAKTPSFRAEIIARRNSVFNQVFSADQYIDG